MTSKKTCKVLVASTILTAWILTLHTISQQPKSWANVALLFDYRCYVPGGKIGHTWPADVGKCLAKFKSMSVDELRTAYNFPSGHTALAFKNRTTGEESLPGA